MRMMTFTSADRAAFLRAASLMGGRDPEELVGRLDDNLWSAPDGSSRMTDQGFLLDAGRQELRWFSGDYIHDLGLSSRRLFAKRGAAALRSLQAVLFHPGVQGLDPVRRAGLHRLVRALADLDEAQVLDRLTGLPESWKECLKVTHRRWSGRPEAREAAGQLRSEMQIPDGSIES